ncbi:MAG: GFA family protein [Rhodobacteraceae bacterium]|nr:GFA family protein [Paracoccaceae bacterium]
MGYCHCAPCRPWSAGPVNVFTLWKPEGMKVTKGAGRIGPFPKSENSVRNFCKERGGHLMTYHPVWGITDVYAATLPGSAFTPVVHVNYAETVLPMKGGLPKMRDFPADLGGGGQVMAE